MWRLGLRGGGGGGESTQRCRFNHPRNRAPINRVEYMHTRGFIHREIKPDNFLIRCISSIWIGEDMQRPSDSQEHSVQVKIIPLLHLVKAWASRNSDDGFLSKPLAR